MRRRRKRKRQKGGIIQPSSIIPFPRIFYHDARRILEYVGKEEEEAKDTERKRIIIRKIHWSENS